MFFFIGCLLLPVQVFHQLIQQDKLEHQGHAINFGVGHSISISVRRNYLYEDAFEKLSPDNGMTSYYHHYYYLSLIHILTLPTKRIV